jgi:hypothetical protein
MARTTPATLLDPMRLTTGENSKKNRTPLNAERTKTNLVGKPGEIRKITTP